MSSKKEATTTATTTTSSSLFAYSWHVNEQVTRSTEIRIYGIDEKHQNVCVIVPDFLPYVYLELPTSGGIIWTKSKAQLLVAAINYRMKQELRMEDHDYREKYRLYYAHPTAEYKEAVSRQQVYSGSVPRKKYPFLFCRFRHTDHIKALARILPYLTSVTGIGKIALIKMHENNTTPILQLTSTQQLPTAGWIQFTGKERKPDDDRRVSRCVFEYEVKWKNLSEKKINTVGRPLLMGLDIEVNSSVPSSMPKAERPQDKVFQISCVFARQGAYDTTRECYLLTLGKPDFSKLDDKDPETEDIKVKRYATEGDLLCGFTRLLQDKQPNIIIGYNIFQFDIPYMVDRAIKECMCIKEFDQQGMNLNGHAQMRMIKWKSSAYQNQEFKFLDAEGRLFIDLLPLVKRDFKLNNYKLTTVAAHFLKGITKDPLTVKDIFNCYRIGMTLAAKGEKSRALAVVGKYNVKDSILVVRLFEVMTTWIALCEMSKVCNTPIFTLCTQGQGIKLFSQVYRECLHLDMVVERNAYTVDEDDHYAGATVFPPVPGLYNMVVPMDFSSLYPTTMVANNICWSTLVHDPDDKIPDEWCHIMQWEDHCQCKHDPKEIRKNQLAQQVASIMDDVKKLREERDQKNNRHRVEEFREKINHLLAQCKPLREERAQIQKSRGKFVICAKRRFRWLKWPLGVLPSILMRLLDTRKNTKKEMKAQKDLVTKMDPNDPKRSDIMTYIDVLDQRQNSLKISCNSPYGILGARKGYLPLMAGAMCTTFRGRQAIEKAATAIRDTHGGNIIYGDSVSGDTPILCRTAEGHIILRSIHDIGDLSEAWESYDQFKAGDSNRKEKQQYQPALSLQVWTKTGWASIKRVIRHKTVKKMYRVLTHTGCVDVTEDHSLLDAEGKIVKPGQVHIGDSLLHSYHADVFNGINMITKEEAYVWGFFMADGSCGSYDTKKYGTKYSWAINNQNLVFLKRAKEYLEKTEPHFKFKILDTLKSSGVYKLVPVGKIKNMVKRYRPLFYDKNKYKLVPDIILNSSTEIKQWFFEGYYTGDGYKPEKDKIIPENGSVRMDCKGKIGVQGLYVLLRSIGYEHVSFNTRESKSDIFRLNASKSKPRKSPIKIKKIIDLPPTTESEFVYDLETESGTFHAGIGQMIVKNTDSNYVNFPHVRTAGECWDYALKVAEEVSKLFPKPMSLAFEEKLYYKFFLLTKKRYMSLETDRGGKVTDKISKKGVLLQRRDNSDFVRRVYSAVTLKIFQSDNMENDRDDILYYIIQEINKLFSGVFPYEDFIITKSVSDIGNLRPKLGQDKKGAQSHMVGDYKVKLLPEDEKLRSAAYRNKNCPGSYCECVPAADTPQCINCQEYYLRSLPAVAQLAYRIQTRGQLFSPGSRLEYVMTTNGGHNAKQYIKIEAADYFARHKNVLTIDYLYYLKQLANPLDQMLNIIMCENKVSLLRYKYTKNFVLQQYIIRQAFSALIEQFRTLASPIKVQR